MGLGVPHAPVILKPHEPVAERVLLPGDPGRALRLAQQLIDGPRMLNHHRGLWGYSGPAADGAPLTIQSTGLGGPSAAAVVAELIALGARRLVRDRDRGRARRDARSARSWSPTRRSPPTARAARSAPATRVAADPALAAALAAAVAPRAARARRLGRHPRPGARGRVGRDAGALAFDLATAAVLAAARTTARRRARCSRSRARAGSGSATTRSTRLEAALGRRRARGARRVARPDGRR